MKRIRECNCCGSTEIGEEFGILSSFTAKRVFDSNPEVINLFRCALCGYSWSELGLDSDSVARLYDGYRGLDYFKQRNYFEPWYTKSFHESITSDAQMQIRRTVFHRALTEAEVLVGRRDLGVVLDHGGDKGQLLKDLPDEYKYVYELSGVNTEPWAKPVDNLNLYKNSCNLVLSCQVLEHANDPNQLMHELCSLMKDGAWLYLEVPFENWSQALPASRIRLNWLGYLTKSHRLLKFFDFISTIMRVKLNWLPPFCFWALREHLNFFTLKSIRALAQKNNLKIILLKTDVSGIVMIAVKDKDNVSTNL